MTVENFIKRFDEVVDGTPGINRIRKLILRLATTGRLIPTDDKGWEKISLNQIASVRMGKTILKNELSASGIPVYSAGRENSAWGYVTESDLTFRAGTIVVSARGTIGFPKIPAESVFISTQTTIAITPTSTEIDPGYFCLQLQTVDWDRLTAKTAIPMITVKQVNAIDVRYPHSHAEQKRIVAKVDELMALCDRLESQLKERDVKQAALAKAALAKFTEDPSPENLQLLFHPSFSIETDDLRKSILNLAVQGKLVPRDPNDAPAYKSVEKASKDAQKAILDERIRKYGLNETPDDTDLADLPAGWRWTRLVEVTQPIRYALKRGPFGSAIRKDMFVPTGFKVYEQQHAISGDFSRGRYYINEVKFNELSAFELHPGEVIVSCSGTVGKVAIVPEGIERGIINQALLKLSLHQSALLNEYFLILFPAFFMETETLTNLSGTAQKNIPGMDVLKVMPFPLPPLAEQRRIVAKVEQLMALVDALETQLEASHTTGEKLLEAMVAELTSA